MSQEKKSHLAPVADQSTAASLPTPVTSAPSVVAAVSADPDPLLSSSIEQAKPAAFCPSILCDSYNIEQ
jgi:hypothetical protein